MGLEMALIYNGIKFSMVGHHTKSIQPWTKVIQQVPQTHYEHLTGSLLVYISAPTFGSKSVTYNGLTAKG